MGIGLNESDYFDIEHILYIRYDVVMKSSLRTKAKRLRANGWSYTVIAKRLPVAKSTLSHWLREVPYTPNAAMRKRIREGPAISAMRKHAQKMRKISLAKKSAALELGKLSRRDLWMLGLGLYIGEGTKLYELVRLINSDPDSIRLAMAWFQKCCGVPLSHFTISIHLYPDVSQKQAIRYWSKITGIPRSQFGKTQIDRRTNKTGIKKRKLPFGTAHIGIRSFGRQEFGVALHRRIIGWIEHIYRHQAGVV